MTKVILDQAALAKLSRVIEPALICDETGNVFGQFQPAPTNVYRNVEVPFTEEELDRFEQEPGGRPLDQILQDLEKLP